MNNKSNISKLLPVMLCFFAMGFVDLVGIASNYVKEDLGLSDAQANIFPSLVFFWFLIFSVPTGVLMNRIGRRKTVLLSLVVTAVSLLLPIFGDSYGLMLCSFSLLGIGNALMQTSLNPLLSNVITGDKLASSLTFGQFVKAIASFLAPYIAMWGATHAIPDLGLEWRVLFPVYMVIAVIAILWLGATQIEEDQPDRASGFADCFRLLGNPFILLCFLGIMCHVGIDVGTNTTAPKLLMERLELTLDEASWATSLYFIFRTLGCLSGTFILSRFSSRSLLWVSVGMMLLAMVGLLASDVHYIIYMYRAHRLRQQQCLFHLFLQRPVGYAAEEERDFRPDDYGSLRRHGLPAADGLCQRRAGSERRRGGDDCRRAVPNILCREVEEGINRNLIL